MDTVFLIARIVLFWLPVIIMGIVAYISYSRERIETALIVIAIILAIAFIVILCITNWTCYAIAKILALIILMVAIYISAEVEYWEPFWMGLGAIAIAFIISFFVYVHDYNKRVEKVEEPKVKITRQELLCANDGTITNGSIAGGGFIVYSVIGSTEEESVYKYYYMLPDGGAKLGQVDADLTTIYYIKDGETPYIETVKTTHYKIDYNENPPKEINGETKTTYRLHVPSGSIGNVYEFDAK